MKFLVIGLGSMGKRRIRNLQALGYTDIVGFDVRMDRCEEVFSKYRINSYTSLDEALQKHTPNVFVISTSPKFHMDYAELAYQLGISCFIEASVLECDRIEALSKIQNKKNIVIAPSCTMRYFPGPKKVKELIQNNVIGKPLTLNYQTGQYLPDWHPWEDIKNFYVSDRETGGAREIVPFELTWLNDIFGIPNVLSCVKTKLSNLSCDIDDIYHCVLSYPTNVLANISIEVLSRPKATRELRIIGTEGQIVMSADEHCVRYISVNESEWRRFSLSEGNIETGYINPEEPYIAELQDFVKAINQKDATLFPNTLSDDVAVLRTLEELEYKSKAIL